MNLRQTKSRLLSLSLTALFSCAAVSHGLTTICCAGNSVTMTAQYPEALQVLFGSTYKVYNEGVGGSGITGWSGVYLTSGAPGYKEIMSIKPQIITIKLGVNDCHGDSASLGTDFVPGYLALIDSFLTISPKPQIYLILPAPMFPPEQQNWGDNLQCMIVPLVKKVAALRSLPVIDCNTAFLNGPDYFPNSVHAAAGSPAADTMTQTIYRALTNSTAPKAQPPLINEINAIAYGNNKYVAVDNMGVISTSTDGKTFAKVYADSSHPLHGVAYGNNQFIAVGYAGMILGSSDGTTWTMKNSPTKEPFFAVTYANGRFMAVGGFGNGLAFTSTDGATWSASVGTSTSTVTGVVFGNNKFVTVSNYGKISTSSTGATWDTGTSGTGTWLTSVTYGNNQFVAVGQNGTILTSSDGLAWVSRTSGTTNWLWSVAYGNNQYVAVGSIGTILTSTDGTTWTKINPGTSKYLTSVTYNNNQFVAGGYGFFLTITGNTVRVVNQARPEGASLARVVVNSACNDLSVHVAGISSHDLLRVELFNTAGRMVYASEARIRNQVFSIRTSGLPTGRYFVSVTDGKNSLLSSGFVKTR